MSTIKSWADAEDDVPSPEVTVNPDGTKTVVSYGVNAKGQKVKITQKMKEIKVTERVHPLIAQRRTWVKYGKEKGRAPGPDTSTTQLGEIVELKLASQWKEMEKQEEEDRAQQNASLVTSQRIKCRLCGGDHYTSKCPFKDTLGKDTKADSPGAPAEVASSGSSAYVPRHLRRDADGNLPTRDLTRDDTNTLKVAQLNSLVDDHMIRNELFARYGPLERVALVRNRETGLSRGFAYVTFATESMAQRALDDLNGKGYHSLILHIEWSKKKKT